MVCLRFVIGIYGTMVMRYLSAVLLFMLSGCASSGSMPDTAGLDAAHVRERIRLVAEAGAGQGAYVCKKYRIGIAEIDWVKGTVIEARQDRIRVKIDDPGSFPHVLGGIEISKGSLVWDGDMGWAPCLKELAGHSKMD